jgi:hypothetical protein
MTRGQVVQFRVDFAADMNTPGQRLQSVIVVIVA